MSVQHQRIVSLCEDLKFHAVADVYASMADVAAQQESSYIEYLEQVLKAENELRQGRSRHTMAKLAGFPAIKTLEDYDFDFASGAPKCHTIGCHTIGCQVSTGDIVIGGDLTPSFHIGGDLTPSFHRWRPDTIISCSFQICRENWFHIFRCSNGSAGDPARVYRARVHWSRWESISFFHFQGKTPPYSDPALFLLAPQGSREMLILPDDCLEFWTQYI